MAKIVIIGGGAAGMTATIAAAWADPSHEILILEHKNQLGKKLLSTGNGRCNFTNAYMEKECFYSDSKDVIPCVLDKFGTDETLDFFRKLGVYPKDRNGYYYPRSDQAQTIQQLLILELKALGVTYKTDIHVTEVQRNKKGFRIFTDTPGMSIHADRLILACGGRAAAVLGSDGSGYTLAKMLGHSLVPVVPALVQLKVKSHPLAKASGVRTETKVEIFDGSDTNNPPVILGSDTGEVQITAYGISGIPVFQISRLAAKLLYEKKTPVVRIDFFPGMSEEELKSYLQKRTQNRETYMVSEFLLGLLNQKLITVLLKTAGIPEKLYVKKLKTPDWDRLISTLKRLELVISDTNGFDNAQVCAGGVNLTEIASDTMESRICKDLYLAGELLDVDGICGGYNLQWAWASGYLAGCAAAGKKNTGK